MIPKGKLMGRLLGQPTIDHHSDSNLSFEARPERPLRPSYSQSARFHAGPPISCLDESPTGAYAVIAGENTFKTIHVQGSNILEDVDLRASIANQISSHGDTLSGFNDQLNIKAIRWAHSELDSTVITASANGRITVYDLNRISSSLEIGRIREHSRQVHKLAVSPYRASLLLSASQDGTARLFDIRTPAQGRAGVIFHSRAVFKCNADAVRDIQWSPSDAFEFACSTASGTVQQWDTRNSTAPIMKISAHNGPCLSISWHPDGQHIVSGGFDQQCYIWDMSRNAERRQKPKYTFATPAPVSIVAWRTPTWSSTAQSHRAAQLAVAYDDTNPTRIQNSTVHVWDIARPSIPFKEITEFESAPTGFLWHDCDMLWTVGREGDFVQTDVAFAPKVIDRRSLSTFDLSPMGDVVMLLEERQGRRRLNISSAADVPSRARSADDSSQSPSGAQLSISLSDSEEDVGGSFLASRPRSRHHSRRTSARSVGGISNTPPSFGSSMERSILDIDEGVNVTGPYRPQQVMAIGHTPSAVSRGVFQYLSSHYLQRIIEDFRDADLSKNKPNSINDRMSAIMEHFAKSAEAVAHYRLAQTWRILSYTVGLLLTRRAEYHRERRLARHDELKKLREKLAKDGLNGVHIDHPLSKDITPRKLLRPRSPLETLIHPAAKSILSEEIESTSNVATPIARPVTEPVSTEAVAVHQSSSIDQDELHLPPAIHSPSPQPPEQQGRRRSPDDSTTTLGGYDFYDMGSIATQAIDISVPQRKAPLRLDLDYAGSGNGLSRPAPLERHDSSESFQMFSTSSDSHPTTQFPDSTDSGGRHAMGHIPRNAGPEGDSSWDSVVSTADPRHTSFRSEDSSLFDDDDSPEHETSSRSRSPPTFRLHEAVSEKKLTGLDDAMSLTEAGSFHQSLQDEDDDSQEVIESDYLPQLGDPSFMPEAIDPHILIPRLIQFEVLTGCLNAAMMVILFKPLLRHGTIDETQAAAILGQYHRRLVSMMLFNEAALIRYSSYPTYPTIFGQGQAKHGLHVAYFCMTCNKPLKNAQLEVGRRLYRCERCRSYLDGCVVCRQHESPLESFHSDTPHEASYDGGNEKPAKSAKITDITSPAARLWWWCQGCGHGGHTSCMRSWHSGSPPDEGAIYSNGCCPMQGCLHPCLSGKWREEVMAERKMLRTEELNKLVKEGTRGSGKTSRPGSVRRDRREISESRAVESVRGALAAGGSGGVSTPERERKKSVKVVAPGEER